MAKLKNILKYEEEYCLKYSRNPSYKNNGLWYIELQTRKSHFAGWQLNQHSLVSSLNLNQITKVIQDSNPDFRINADLHPDICRICPKLLWMHYLVGVSHFAKYGTNQPLIVWKMLTNVKKKPLFRNGEENKTVIWNPHANLHHLQKLITSRGSITSCPCLPRLVDVRFHIHESSCL